MSALEEYRAYVKQRQGWDQIYDVVPRKKADAVIAEFEAELSACLLQTSDAHISCRKRTADALARAEKARDALKQQAQIWAQEARTQRATVRESYQVTTGATGEPGDWHGAEPIRKLKADLAAVREEARKVQEVIDWVKCVKDGTEDEDPCDACSLYGVIDDGENCVEAALRIVQARYQPADEGGE